MSSYEPQQLEALGRAFDIAWARISPSLDNRRAAMEVARLTLAGIILGLAKGGNFTPSWLADNAARAMLCAHRELSHKSHREVEIDPPRPLRGRCNGLNAGAR